MPTDTVYGLAASPSVETAVDRIFALKGRPRTRNLPIMVAGRAGLDALGVVVNDTAQRLLESSLMPGAMTLALEVRPQAAPAWLSGRDEVAVRIPDHAFLLSVLELTGPLLVTSANAHGQPTPILLADALLQLAGRPDMAIDGGAAHEQPSTLVNCRTVPPTIEREGAIPAHVVMEFLNG